MQTYDSVPSAPGFDEIRQQIPSKWEVGGSCPNCNASDRGDGTLKLVDRDDPSNRFRLVCSNQLNNRGCGFTYGIDTTFTATVPDDYRTP